MKPRALTGYIAVLAIGACSPGDDPPITSIPQVVGRITDRGSGLPLEAIVLLVDYAPIAITDSAGWYELSGWDNGNHLITVTERGYLSYQSQHLFPSEGPDTLHIELNRAAPPCCNFVGEWHIELRVESMGHIEHRPATKQISGAVYFSDTISDPLGLRRSYRGMENVALGYFDVPFSRFFGSQIAKDISSTIAGGSPDTFEREVVGYVFSGDSIEVSFVPRISHGAVSLLGRLRGDSIAGKWHLRADADGSTGDFTMTRARR